MKISGPDFTEKMHHHLTYPAGRLLKLQDIIQEDQMRNPDMVDNNNKPCLLVIKNGSTSGVTIGRATGIFSYTRRYFEDAAPQRSKEWAILPYDKHTHTFSEAGDSGSIVVDGHGRIGGLLTGGCGMPIGGVTTDVTYVTPFFWLWPRIKSNGFPEADLNPVMA